MGREISMDEYLIAVTQSLFICYRRNLVKDLRCIAFHKFVQKF